MRVMTLTSGTAYTAERAAALSGVPVRTVQRWARREIVTPSVGTGPRLWSFEDLLALRLVDWLRREKPGPRHDQVIPPSRLHDIEAGLDELRRLDLDLWLENDRSRLCVNDSGKILVMDGASPHPRTPEGQYSFAASLDLLAAYEGVHRGPDLRRPRPLLRIVPGRLSGEPLLEGTRIRTREIAALARRGFSVEDIAHMYRVDAAPVAEAIDLEQELQGFEAAA